MAPKPPAAKAPAKGPAGKSASENPSSPEKPPRTPSKLELCLASYNCATLGILMLFSLSLYTLWYISLCAVEKAKREPLRNAVAQIRKFMISRNAEYDVLNDTDLIVEAEKVARQLIPWSQKIQEIRIEIADLHHKLNHNWQAHNGHLYLFSYEKLNFQDTIKLCNKSQASIADVQDDDEERFLEHATKHKYGSYWIGLYYINRTWRWVMPDSLPQKTYWMEDEPYRHGRPKCTRLQNKCNTQLACWYTVDCVNEGRGICKRKPETKWIN
ncbi:C-type lectin domain family 4 member M-like isoform X1 [Crotalus tigris]|uniref:C-type lectin domain family 4 member M-like isoform X1 n=1 Tax=Crotalus tigris TaxID=88082 RepID=UPI00192F652E|nr:C-type lectin domain family 4 member M-like isoform X1 [Crotalus tigris]